MILNVYSNLMTAELPGYSCETLTKNREINVNFKGRFWKFGCLEQKDFGHIES